MGIINKELYSDHQNVVADIFWVLSHPGRSSVITLLIAGPMTLGQIQERIGLSQSSTSDQVAALASRGWIYGVRAGTSMVYHANRDALGSVHDTITQFSALFSTA